MLVLGNKHDRFEFTPDHRWPIFYDTRRDGKTIKNLRRMELGYRLSKGHRIPRACEHSWNGMKKLMNEREAALVGWIFTDGHMRLKNNKYPEAVIYQKKDRHLDKIRALLGDDAKKEWVDERSGTVHFTMSSELARLLHGWCPTKDDLPRLVSMLLPESAEAMWQAMMDAEGSVHERAGTSFTQNRGPVAVAFQLLTIMLGKSCQSPGRADGDPDKKAATMYVSEKHRWLKVATGINHEWHKGKVWCPTTKNGTWFMEHDGRHIITGNSWARRNLGNQVYFLANQPGWIASSEKIRHSLEEILTGDQQVPEELRPDWMREQQAAQILGDSDKGYVFLLASWLPFQDMVKLASGAISYEDGIRAAVEQMRPEIKFLMESSTGHDIFRRQEIDTSGGVFRNILPALAGVSDNQALNNLLAIRPIRETYRTASMPETGGKITRALIGGAVQRTDRVRGLKSRAIEIRDEMRKVRSRLNRARENADTNLADQLLKRWLKLNVEARRLGIEQGTVAKRTQQTLKRFNLPQGEPAFAE